MVHLVAGIIILIVVGYLLIKHFPTINLIGCTREEASYFFVFTALCLIGLFFGVVLIIR
jgi:hypothetical protein